ncbi:hypothetical protein EDB84DRAFT_1442513 [Lactarius hengduanensis]|nr:hypothetical protein EDB84DRAFT_1442513 [Lactarius hengduanensis]
MVWNVEVECVGWGRRDKPPNHSSSLPPIDSLYNLTMPMFEITVGPPVTENIHTFQTPGTKKHLSEDPTVTHRCGSIMSNQEKGMTMEWANEEEFLAWRAAKESDKTIELIVNAHTNGRVASRPRRIPAEGARKIPRKKLAAWCQLTIKLYPHTETILGKYESEHDHPLGDENLRFTRLSHKTKDLVMELVHIGVDTKAVIVENEEIRLDENDAVSIKIWATRLQQDWGRGGS